MQLKWSDVTPKPLWLNRRQLIAGGAALAAAPAFARIEAAPSKFSTTDAPNSLEDITSYNNYYEFGTGKEDPSTYAGGLTVDPWSIVIDGMVDKPGTYDLADVMKDQPLEEQRSSDYAEAAYLAFETGNGDQAMEILNTGLHRFPKDTDYAYRAGWISLLTARWDRAHLYLTAGERTGFPEEKREKALAMLAIAASECGYSEDAAIYFEQLAAIDPTWADPDPPKAEGWPPELKISITQLAHPPKAMPVTEDGLTLDLPPPDDGNLDPLAPLDPVPMVEDVLPLPEPGDPSGFDP
ncbi:MAG: hypothetical protein EON48_06730, partial [Acetobacteraceae bacterium]